MKIWTMRKYILERSYPYIIALLCVGMCRHIGLNITDDVEYKDLLDGLITLDSIIIGFLGAVMPVILSMKNESKFVKYVFEKDTENLFCKYLKITLMLGIANVVTTLIQHVRGSIPTKMQIEVYYLWIFLTVAFLLATYRSMSHMITLIFAKDPDEISTVDNSVAERKLSKDRRDEIVEKYRSKGV